MRDSPTREACITYHRHTPWRTGSWQAQLQAGYQRLVDAGQQIVHAGSCRSGNPDLAPWRAITFRLRWTLWGAFGLTRQQVYLVLHEQDWFVLETKVVQDGLDNLNVLPGIPMRDVHNVQQERCLF